MHIEGQADSWYLDYLEKQPSISFRWHMGDCKFVTGVRLLHLRGCEMVVGVDFLKKLGGIYLHF